jgi:hypothetical protein
MHVASLRQRDARFERPREHRRRGGKRHVAQHRGGEAEDAIEETLREEKEADKRLTEIAEDAVKCEHGGCKIIGHGVEAGPAMYCCAGCAKTAAGTAAGAALVRDPA